MTILIVNDDGIDATGINILAERLKSEHNVYVVAPSKERSGMSHAITIIEPVRICKVSEKKYSCSGSPADCVLYSTHGVIEEKIDLVISGINHGPNLGTDIVYSGTVAGARQAAFEGIPSIAVSGCCSYSKNANFPFEIASEYIAKNLYTLMSKWKSGVVVNINIPTSIDENTETVYTKPARRFYDDKSTKVTAADGSDYYFLSGATLKNEVNKDTDVYAVQQGKVSVSLVNIHPLSIDNVDLPSFLNE